MCVGDRGVKRVSSLKRAVALLHLKRGGGKKKVQKEPVFGSLDFRSRFSGKGQTPHVSDIDVSVAGAGCDARVHSPPRTWLRSGYRTDHLGCERFRAVVSKRGGRRGESACCFGKKTNRCQKKKKSRQLLKKKEKNTGNNESRRRCSCARVRDVEASRRTR